MLELIFLFARLDHLKAHFLFRDCSGSLDSEVYMPHVVTEQTLISGTLFCSYPPQPRLQVRKTAYEHVSVQTKVYGTILRQSRHILETAVSFGPFGVLECAPVWCDCFRFGFGPFVARQPFC